MTSTFLTGHVIDCLRQLPDDFFHCVVTSPPYYSLRAYVGDQEVDWADGWRGCLGAEPYPGMYVNHLVEIFREVRRVLRPDGVFWLNVGDSNASDQETLWQETTEHTIRDVQSWGMKPLDRMLIPFHLAIALRNDGWYVRQDCLWSKPNPMPASVKGWRWERHRIKIKKAVEDWKEEGRKHGGVVETAVNHVSGGNTGFKHKAEWRDCPGCKKCEAGRGYILRKGAWRPTPSHEYVFMLTKSDTYYCDQYGVVEKAVGDSDGVSIMINGVPARNMRSVWVFPTKPFRGDHYAAYPPRLPELAIRSSVSEKGCCPRCGTPWARIVETDDPLPVVEEHYENKAGYADPGTNPGVARPQLASRSLTQVAERLSSRERAKQLFPDDPRKQQEYVNYVHDHRSGIGRPVGWMPSCSCGAPLTVHCRVLDPFSGAGTTAVVAKELGVDCWSIDISEKYNRIASDRVGLSTASQTTEKATASPETPVAGKSLPVDDLPPAAGAEYDQWLAEVKRSAGYIG